MLRDEFGSGGAANKTQVKLKHLSSSNQDITVKKKC